MSSLWDYSSDVYARAGVAEACLELQHHHGVDVNLLLYCCWAGERGIELSAAGAAAAVALCEPWSMQTVGRLRAARTWMKTANAISARVAASDYRALRDAIKALELEAERLQQLALASLIADRAQADVDTAARLGCMSANLARYLSTIATRIDDDMSRHLGTLLAGASGAQLSAVYTQLRQAGLASRLP